MVPPTPMVCPLTVSARLPLAPGFKKKSALLAPALKSEAGEKLPVYFADAVTIGWYRLHTTFADVRSQAVASVPIVRCCIEEAIEIVEFDTVPETFPFTNPVHVPLLSTNAMCAHELVGTLVPPRIVMLLWVAEYIERVPFACRQNAASPDLFVVWRVSKRTPVLPLVELNLIHVSTVRFVQLQDNVGRYNHPEVKLIAPKPAGNVVIAVSRYRTPVVVMVSTGVMVELSC